MADPLMPVWRLALRNKVRVAPGNRLEVARNIRIRHCQISIKGTGNRLVIEPGANLRGVQLEIDGEGCELRIGAETVIGEGCYLSCRESGTRLVIGRDGMLSRNVKVMTSDGHEILAGGQRINPARSITVGDHVWLADGAIVLKGATIGDNAVVGIASLVTGKVEAGCVVAGNPARVVKQGVTWLR